MRVTSRRQTGAIRRPLVWAILLSGLFHGFLLYQSMQLTPAQPPKAMPMTVALAPKAVIKPEPIPKPLKRPKPPAPAPKKAVAKSTTAKKILKQTPKVIAATPAPESVTAIAAPQAPPEEKPWVKTKSTVVKKEPAWAKKPVAEVDTSLPEVVDEAVQPYLSVDSLYDVYADTAQQQQSRAVLGKAKMVYQRDHEDYSLNSEVRPSGIMRLFLDDLIQQSHGKITPEGLQPATFLYQYDKKKYEVTFDWQAQQLRMHSHKGDKNVPMQSGTQDLLSFMFQFMFRSPLEQTGMMITNGKSVHRYQYQFMGEAQVETKIGVFNTVHIVRDDPVKNEQLALWLARDYQYLPVKIKNSKPNKNKNYELLIRALKTDQGEVQGDKPTNTSAVEKPSADKKSEQETRAPQGSNTPAQPFNPLIQR